MTGALLLVLALQAQDPVQVGARLTEEEIRAGETTILRVDVETEGERARIERFRTLPPGIEVVGTRDYDQRQFSLPGGTRRFITREFVLRARAPGRYRIPSVTVVVEGRSYSTRSQLLTVTSAPTRERGETGATAEGVILRAWLDADTVFVGEQVTLEVEAMFSQEARMRLRRAPEYEAPSPAGFWVHELPDPGRPVRQGVGGEVYEVQRFRRAFFPLAPGSYTIPPARLEYEMRRGLLYAPDTRELTSDPMPLTVLPIPADRPPAFNGAVGDFDVRARLEPATVPVGEASVLTVEVEGTGNVKALPAPALPEIPGVEVFPPSEEAESSSEGTTIRGRKTFSWVLIPRRAGELEVPPVRYAWFDPGAGGFETAAMGPGVIRATPAPAAGDARPPATIRFLKTRPEPDPVGWVRASWFAGLQAVPLLLLAFALVWHRRRSRRGRLSVGGLRRERKRRFDELDERAGDPDDAELYADAEDFARDWVARRLGVARSEATDPVVLRDAGVPDTDVAALRGVLDRLAAGRFAPTPPTPGERRVVIGGLRRVLEAVDRAVPTAAARAGPGTTPGSPAGGAAAGMVVLLLTIPALAALTAPADATAQAAVSPDTLFDRGLAAFEADAYRDAAELFERYVGRAPRDAAGWYNLGTAYYRAGETGRGIRAWLAALRLDPRDDDTRHNLLVAGAAPELMQRAAPFPLRTSELALLAAVAWLLGGAALALWVLRRSRPAGVGGLAAMVTAVALAGLWWGSTRGEETLIVLDGATLRAGPSLRSEPVSTLDPGTGLVPVDRYGDWVRARTLRGDEGWIERNRTGSL
ncbi:MAG: BatD family protein [Longimicrobiales bacterium]|nr:BatD family protein [Longimicrobiales bacterium]